MNQKNKKFWVWKNQTENDTGSERVLELYGSIANEAWFSDDITPKMFHDELFAGSGPVTIWLSSPGGDCIAASQIYAMLMDYPSDVTVKIDGLAASAASVIAMAGTKVLMAPTAIMLIHNPITNVCGNRDELQKAIEMLDEVKESIINAYEIKTGLSRAKISHLMDAELPMQVGTAIELGFADGILEDKKKSKTADDFLSTGNAVRIAIRNEVAETAKPDKTAEESGEESAEEPKQDEPEQGTEPAKDTPAEPENKEVPEAEPPEENAPAGTPVSDLEKRLNLLK